MTSPDEKLVVFQPNFTGMILVWYFFKLAKRIEFHEELWLPWQPIEKTFINVNLYQNCLKPLTQLGQMSVVRAIMALSLLYGSGLRGTIQGHLCPLV